MFGNNKEIKTCKCGAIVVVPKNHVGEVECADCKKDIGLKVYEALN